MIILKQGLAMLLGLGSGIVIAGAVFAFIAIIGIVPRLAQKTQTAKQVVLYEEVIIFGGIFGAFSGVFDFYLPIGKVMVALFSFFCGMFYGCLAMSLAEVIDVIPILTRRASIQQGMFFFVLAIAIGKLAGSLLYYMIPGF